MRKENIGKEYFRWLCRFVEGNSKSKYGSYEKLLSYLHNTDFIWTIPMDSNRADDGKELRRRFSHETNKSEAVMLYFAEKPCSVLEMMIALADRCESCIMCDPDIGDRTGQWFWGMIANLGLGRMTDRRYDADETERIISNLLHRNYGADGAGGLFTVRRPAYDMRTVEIWCQAMWRLNEIST